MKKKYKILLRTLCSCEKKIEIPTLTPIIEVMLGLTVVRSEFNRRCFIETDEIHKGRIVYQEYLSPSQLGAMVKKVNNE